MKILLMLALSGIALLPPSVSAAQPRAGGLAAAQDARDTRERLHDVLNQYPPALAQVIRLDPSLLARPDYLAPYPALTAYLAEHPEIARSPAYYFGDVPMREVDNVRFRTVGMVQDVMFGMLFLTGFSVFLLSLGWLIRTALADRRWQRLTKIQTEAHTKLLDRLTTHEDLLTYIQSPTGRRFLDAGPIPLDEGVRAPLTAPVTRILWSVQAGLVLVAVGLGLFFAKNQVLEEIASPIYVFGIIAVALGIGFVVSAVVAYALSQRLGLLNAPRTHDA